MRPVVREFPNQIPAGVQFFVLMGRVEGPGRPDQFESAAANLVLFHTNHDGRHTA